MPQPCYVAPFTPEAPYVGGPQYLHLVWSHMGASKNQGPLLESPYDKDHNTWESVLGLPVLGNLKIPSRAMVSYNSYASK